MNALLKVLGPCGPTAEKSIGAGKVTGRTHLYGREGRREGDRPFWIPRFGMVPKGRGCANLMLHAGPWLAHNRRFVRMGMDSGTGAVGHVGGGMGNWR